MEVKVQKWGNSLAVRIPKIYTDALNVHRDSLLTINRKDNQLILEPKQKEQKLKTLLSQVTSENIHDEIDTGEGVGNEVW